MSEQETPTAQTENRGRGFWIGVLTMIVVMLALGWYFAKTHVVPARPVQTVECAPIPEGMAWRGGKLVAMNATSSPMDACAPVEASETADSDWLPPVQTALNGAGYDWLGLSLDGNDLHVSGSAPDADARELGFRAAVTAIESADDGAHAGLTFINDIGIAQPDNSWVSGISASLKNLGFNWLVLDVRGPVATVSGNAPDAATRDDAFTKTEAAIAADPLASVQVGHLVNGITLDGEDSSAAEALIELTKTEGDNITVEACGTAFADTMNGRNIEFRSGSARIDPQSAQLLNALSGIAILCVNTNGYAVEVAGHTDATGDPAANQVLSLERAKAVRGYLIRLGVERNRIKAIGYGQDRPLVEGVTAEANARNRRTEFIVTADEPAP